MKTAIKITSIITSLIMTAGVCGCSLVLPQKNSGGANDAAKDVDALCGLFMVFYDGEKAITEEDFAADQAIKIYFGKHYYNEETDDYYMESVCGRDVFSDIAYNYKTNELDDKLTGYDVSITASLHHTKALTGYEMHTYGIYFDEERRTYYTSDLNETADWSGLAGIARSQSIKLYDKNSEELSYNCKIEINFQEICNVTQLNIIEFDGDNNLVKRTDNYLGTDYQTSDDCQYVVIEEISHDGEGETAHRTLIEKDEEGVAMFNRYIPDEYGLAANQQVKINF